MTKIIVKADTDNIKIRTDKKFNEVISKELTRLSEIELSGGYEYTLPLSMYNCFVLSCLKNKLNDDMIFFDDMTKDIIQDLSKNTIKPTATILNEKRIAINVPAIHCYQQLLTLINATNVRLTLWSIPIGRIYEFYRLLTVWKHPFLPEIEMSEELLSVIKNKISQNNSMKNLFNIELPELISVKEGYRVKPEGFEKIKCENAVDLLLSKPIRYEDRVSLYNFQNAPYDKSFYLKGKIISFTKTVNDDGIIKIFDGQNEKELYMYKKGWLTRIYEPGDIIYLNLKRAGRSNFNVNSIISEFEAKSMPILPIYKQSTKNGITTKILTNSTQELLLRYNGNELLNYIEGTKKSFWKSIEDLHFPSSITGFEETINSLAYYELVLLQALFIDKKLSDEKALGVPKLCDGPKIMKEAINNFPYTPTVGQQNAVKEIIKSLQDEKASNILLSGDVGSGKSFVANCSALYNYDSGYQTAMIAPTEILARQLYEGLMKQLEGIKNKPIVLFFNEKTKAAEKREIIKQIEKGNVDIIVGTHSLFNLEYKNLGLIIIDEQQKFGRNQREKLLHSRKDNKVVDLLSQTATPIPQTTALAFYGDIDLITLDEKPAGRKENITKWIKQSSSSFLKELANPTWSHIFKEIEAGNQIFIVTPAVEESSKSASVKATTSILEKKYPKLKIDNIHGTLKKETQTKKLNDFRDNKTNVLIASSIIEVGIDIPNATIIVVLDADRFGASSLHQIRGRVGRSNKQGYCYLIAENKNANTEKRLQSLVDSNNGFDIALIDLETRNTGDLLGTQQSGNSNLRFCNLADHSKIITEANYEANRLYNSKYKSQLLEDARAFLKKDEDD